MNRVTGVIVVLLLARSVPGAGAAAASGGDADRRSAGSRAVERVAAGDPQHAGGRKATKARVAIALAQDWADHYAQAAMYLRLNGILPPSARPRNCRLHIRFNV